jgi:hypothetical protein
MNSPVRLLAVCSLFIANTAIAATPVEIVNTTPDAVGARLVYAIKENIRGSYSLTLSIDQAKPRLLVDVLTLDQDPAHPGNASAYSVVILWSDPAQVLPCYLNQNVGICGSNRVDECAENLVARISEQSDNLHKTLQQPMAEKK